MKTGLPWLVKGVRPQARETAREAARCSGISVGQWLDSMIVQQAFEKGVEPLRTTRTTLDDRSSRHPDFEERLRPGRRRYWAEDAAAGDHAGSAPPDSASSLDQALIEIAERQRILDSEAPHGELPRSPTQDLGGLEQQLRDITSRIELVQPCGVAGAIESLRKDLAEIGLTLREAMPRQAIETLESEVRALAERIADTRPVGEDAAIVAIECGLAEIRDALHALTPAESLAGFDEKVRELSHTIERLAASKQAPGAVEQLETAIAGLRGIMSHVASNDALTKLSAEVHLLAARVEETAGRDLLSTLEQCITLSADALQTRPHADRIPQNIETAVAALDERLRHLQPIRADSATLDHLENRIGTLIDKLDASDARLTHIEVMERTVVDLLAHLEDQRHPTATTAPGIECIKEEVLRPRHSLETVLEKVGQVVERLATMETDVRSAISLVPPQSAATPIAAEPMLPEEPITPSIQTAAPAEQLSEVFAPWLACAAPPPAQHCTPELPRPRRPAPGAGRRAIDPSLPPDHPLEPGRDTVRTYSTASAERIAASEASLGPTRIPANGRPRSNFIAAARRAAQAAGSEPPARDLRSPLESIGRRRLASPFGKRGLSLLVIASVVLIVLGSLMVSLSGSRDDAEDGAPSETTQAAPVDGDPSPGEAPAAGPTPVAPLPHAEESALEPAAPPAPGRRSSLPWGASFKAAGDSLMLGTDPALPAHTQAAALEPASTATLGSSPAANHPAGPTAGAAESSGNARDKLPASLGSESLRAAAMTGDPAAQFEVGLRFAEGRGVRQDLAAAADWFDRAAKQGLAPAQFRLGTFYEQGLGVKKDRDNARRLYLAAGRAGNAKALHNLAVLYAEGIDGKSDYPTAAKWFRKAADYGVTDSQYNLGILYARGIGVDANLAEAYKWFVLAARDGDKEAAKKRDNIGARLDQPSLTATRSAAEVWRAEPQPESAIAVKTTLGGWDGTVASPNPKGEPGTKSGVSRAAQ